MRVQSLYKVAPHATLSMGQNDTMARRPTLAIIVAESIGVWSEIDSLIDATFAFVLGRGYENRLLNYFKLRGLDQRRAHIDAACKSLPSQTRQLLDAIVRLVAEQADYRDRLAHWCWGTSDELPNALILVDPRYKTQHLVSILNPVCLSFDTRHAFVLAHSELEAYLKTLIEIRDIIGRMSGVLWERNSPVKRKEFLKSLSAEPLVVEKIHKLQRDRKRTRKSNSRNEAGRRQKG